MSQEQSNADITPDMSVLDVLSLCRETEGVFRSYDEAAGECICCNVLFEPLRDVAKKYNLDLEQLIIDLRATARKNDRKDFHHGRFTSRPGTNPRQT